MQKCHVARFDFADIEEPPPPRRGRRLLVALGVLVVVGAVVVGWFELGSGQEQRPARRAGAEQSRHHPVSGVLFFDPTTGRVGVATPSGSGPRTLTGVTTSGDVFAARSPDHRHVVFSDGTELDLATGAVSRPLAGAFPHIELARQPWAAGGTFLLVVFASGGTQLDPTLVGVGPQAGAFNSLASQRAFAADPRAAAAFAVGAEAGGGKPLLVHETRAFVGGSSGSPPVLASAAVLGKALGLRAGDLTLTDPVVSPDGQYVAVGVAETRRGSRAPRGGWTVLSRAGDVVVSTPTSHAHPTWAVWSPDDRLGYAETTSDGGSRLWVTDPRRPAAKPRLVTLPTGTSRSVLAQPCVWSPGGELLVCGDSSTWVTVDVAGGRARVQTGAPGRPLAWVRATRS